MEFLTSLRWNYPPQHFRSFNAIAYRVPIELRERTLREFKAAGIPVRLRYRGPRAVSIGREMKGVNGITYRRTRSQAWQDCLLEDATHFTVYKRPVRLRYI